MDILVSANTDILNRLQKFNLLPNGISSPDEFNDFIKILGDNSFSIPETVQASSFNFWEHRDDFHIVYNSLYNSLIYLSSEEFLQMRKDASLKSSLIRELTEQGIFIDKSWDEKRLYFSLSDAERIFDVKELSLVLTTTMECNARCAYCYEAGSVKKPFDENAKINIFPFLEKQGMENGVSITWFGGEPLLNTDLIDYVTEELLKRNVKFSAYLISNGSMLNEKMLKNKFDYWHIKGMQITIDGTREQYNKIKRYQKGYENVYDQLLSNIRIAGETGIHVDIRLNIDQRNKEDIITLAAQLTDYYSDQENITLYPAFITGTSYSVPQDERVLFLKQLLETVNDPGKLSFTTKIHSIARTSPCNIANYRAFGIDVDGYLYDCEHYVGKAGRSIGDVWGGLFKPDTRTEKFKLTNECVDCVWVPKCYGGCQAHRLNDDIPCMVESYMIPAYIGYMADYHEKVSTLPSLNLD